MFGASKTASGSNLGPSDPYYEYVTMLLTGDGTNGAQNNTFVDSSTNNYTVTRYGNTTQGSFSPYGSLWSNYFDGSSYISIPKNSNLEIGASQDFTIEYWVNPENVGGSYNNVFGMSSKDYCGVTSSSIYLNGDSDPERRFTTTINKNTWYHIAWSRNSGTLKGFVNGTEVGSVSESSKTYFTNSSTLYYGAQETGSYPFKGCISNLRIVKGTGLYTGNFTPSTTPLTAISGTQLLTGQSNRFIDNSSNAYTLSIASGSPSVQRFSPFNPTVPYTTATIGGSGYFDGSGDYLTTPYNSANTLSGNFTIEFWLYLKPITGGANSGYNGVFMMRDSPSWSSGGLMIGIKNNYLMEFYTYDQGSLFTTAISPNTWNHIAFVRSGTTVSSYLNGVFCNSYTASTSFSGNGGPVWFGNNYDGTNYYLNGYVTDLRVVNGTALYSGSSYTVPTAPLTAISNTSLLMNYKNANIIDSAMMNDLETVGNAQVSTSVKKYGTGSISYSSDNSTLKAPATPLFAFGNTFTIEGWFYPTSISQDHPNSLWNFRDGDINNFELRLDSNGSLTLHHDGNQYAGTSSNVISTNTWYHIAVVDNNGTQTIYVDGVSKATGTSSGATQYTFANIGSRPANNWWYTGYIDDFRITSGIARYTANFTPPTTAFPTY